MDKKVKALLSVLLLVLVIGGAYAGYKVLSKGNAPQPTQPTQATSGSEAEEKTPAPDFRVFDGSGKEIRLSDFKGEIVVINFWASWCPPCKEEMPFFQTAYEQYGDRVKFMMLDLVDGSRETKATGQKFIADNKYTFPVYFDTNSDAAIKYGISSIPTTVFIDKDGNIVTGYVGSVSGLEDITAVIEMILKGK